MVMECNVYYMSKCVWCSVCHTLRKKEQGGGGGWREEGETRKEIVVGQTAPVRYDVSVSVRARLRCLGPGEILRGRSRFS